MEPWYEVATPRKEVREGRSFNPDEFAIALEQVVAGTAPEVPHWARVLENGRRLLEATGARRDIVELFAVFHDSQRINGGIDDGHGRRGAELAGNLRGVVYELDDEAFDLAIPFRHGLHGCHG